MKNNSNPFILLVCGLAIGAIAGILLAPDEGVKTRKKLSKKANKLKKSIGDTASEYKDKVTDLKDNISEKASDLKKVFS